MAELGKIDSFVKAKGAYTGHVQRPSQDPRIRKSVSVKGCFRAYPRARLIKTKNINYINDNFEVRRCSRAPLARCDSAAGQHDPTVEEERFKKLLQSKEKVIKLQFYLQDALGSQNATVWEVARAEITDESAASFGQVRVLDDLITVEPDRNSEKLGRAQGMITFTGLEESALTMNLNFYFTSGEYKGSTLCLVGRNPISHHNRELPIVGGTGVFRMARGYSISNTYSFDSATNYGVLEYIVYVAYLDEYVDSESD